MIHGIILTRKKTKERYVVTKMEFDDGNIVLIKANSLFVDEEGCMYDLVLRFPCDSAIKRFKREFKVSYLTGEVL